MVASDPERRRHTAAHQIRLLAADDATATGSHRAAPHQANRASPRPARHRLLHGPVHVVRRLEVLAAR